MDPTASPGILGAFVTSFLGLVGVVVWIIRQQLGQSQKLIDTIPEQIKLFVTQMDKAATQTERLAVSYQEQLAKAHTDSRAERAEDREFFAKQLDVVTKAFAAGQRDNAAAMKAIGEAIAEATQTLSGRSAGRDGDRK
jgi:predicted PurR-regulated permease PerM